jgi:hypothetical protein
LSPSDAPPDSRIDLVAYPTQVAHEKAPHEAGGQSIWVENAGTMRPSMMVGVAF